MYLQFSSILIHFIHSFNMTVHDVRICLKLLVKCQSYNINHIRKYSKQISNLTKQFKFFKNTIRKSLNKKVAGKPSSIATTRPSLLTKGFQYTTLLGTLGWWRFYTPKTNDRILIREVVGMYKRPYPLDGSWLGRFLACLSAPTLWKI